MIYKKHSNFKLIIQVSLALLLAGLSAFAQVPLSSLGLDATVLATLEAEGKVTATGTSISDIKLMPNALLSAQLQGDLAQKGVKSTVESLYLLPNAKGLSTLALYQRLLNIASLDGLEFYSRSEKKLKTLIYNAHFVESMSNKTPIDSPRPSALVPLWQGIMMQNDETFGAKHYSVALHANNNELLMLTRNIDKLTQGIITTANQGEMLMALYLIQTPQGLLIYQLIANTQGVPGFVRNKAYESLFNRQEAFKTWIAALYG
jgi:hypothetical protein